MLDNNGLIKELRAYKLADQLLFHSTESLKYLSFQKSLEVKNES